MIDVHGAAVIPTVFTVGVTGHRVLPDETVVRGHVTAVLQAITAAAKAVPGFQLRILSPLAEGADRLVADSGLSVGASLQCIFPFHRDLYEADFVARVSKDAFRRIVEKADAVLELDGSRADPELAYEATGRLVVAHSDVLIAIWDGEASHGRGGTAEIVEQALSLHVPVVWIRPDRAAPPARLAGSASRPLAAPLGDLADLFTPPCLSRPEGEPLNDGVTLQMFLDERSTSLGFASAFDLFTRVMLLNFRLRRTRKAGWLEESRAIWRGIYDGHAAVQTACAPCLDGQAIEAFSRADALAQRYAGLYRSAFVINFFLSAVAVGTALFHEHEPRWPALALEFAVISVILLVTAQANLQRWHERWIEYRHLAEQLRPIRFLFPLGLMAPKARLGRPISGREQASGWIDWLTHRVERSLGVPNVVVDAAYLGAVRTFTLEAVLNEQIDYHHANAEKLHKVDHRLHLLGSLLFITTALICGLDLAWALSERWIETLVFGPGLSHIISKIRPGLIFVFGVFPALGATILGIRNVGEFARLTRRSLAMKAALGRFRDELSTPSGHPRLRGDLRSDLEAIAAQMMSETADWRTLVIDRRIEWPG